MLPSLNIQGEKEDQKTCIYFLFALTKLSVSIICNPGLAEIGGLNITITHLFPSLNLARD